MNTSKRLTDAELTAEWSRAAFVAGCHGPHIWGTYVDTLQRFRTLPHWTPESSS